jgi:osmotically-inducible protein OsmY
MKLSNSIVAIALGAAAMYYLDPELGRRRRAMLRDQMAARRNEASRYLGRNARRAAGELQGVAYGVRSAMGMTQGPADDGQLRDRIRSALGRLVSTPGAINVGVAGGNVLLTGHVLAGERDRLVSSIAGMDGVERVSDQMAVYDEPGNVPELQGAKS